MKEISCILGVCGYGEEGLGGVTLLWISFLKLVLMFIVIFMFRTVKKSTRMGRKALSETNEPN